MRNAYIVDYELYIPSTYIDYRSLALETGLPEWVVRDKLGINRKPIERSLSVSDMAKLTAKKLMSKYSNIKIDLVAYAGSDFKDKYVWDVAPDVIGYLGLDSTYGVDISMQCVSSIVALDLLKPRLILRDEDSYALLVSATKQSMIVNYKDKASTFMYDFSDGAAAVLLSNVDGRYKILESSIITNGRFSNIVYQRLGERFINDNNQDYLLQVNRNEEFNKSFEEISLGNFLYVIRNAVEKSGFEISDVDYFAMLHMKRSFHERILRELGVSLDRSIYLEDYGHMQAVDPFLSLWLAEQNDKIRKDSIIVLVAAGTGWTWGAIVIQRVK
ncbi:3-oxoacyl-[acyl-carrier-protein] synthase III C-terminal domain-containing protein [Vulcanisaeta souniana]|uniref:3-oxoacyl-[acyl-carrier-protein] synthase 3 n=1 Tax=Vulcanisaeta souniana JCM 11219 TaxID=1293586 RepID=A0A830EH61_9CREN|nr:3-oxoacyl-[acyl-carrier-protein] synthase III C-terminal domain-containing protein [Vulcanisaeta souniana]BDR91708.1 3-oxoacyl-[acyl-carrier-protein] synthase 3 [Vulcanisaeta souniana JCM 11219]GGI71057.1 3-oxoacyl-[acyl-carrier-protein] synthase 3 [Vulcanisaeta souniana JCM 11219]